LRPEPGRLVLFSLALAVDNSSGKMADIKEIVKDIRNRVNAKIQELEQDRKNNRRLDQNQLEKLNDAIRTLKAYTSLHDIQVSPALSGKDSATLADVIAKTGSPDVLVQQTLQPLTVQPAVIPSVVPVTIPSAVPVARPANVAPQRVARPAARTAGAVKKGTMIGKLFKFVVVSTVILTPTGYLAYANGYLPKPAEQWVDRQIVEVKKLVAKISGGSSGEIASADIMTALRQSADELGWKRDGEKEMTVPDMAKLAEIFGMKGASSNVDPNTKLYQVGERNPRIHLADEDAKLLPVPCVRDLMVYDYRRTDTAVTFMENSRKSVNQVPNFGVKVEILPMTVPGTDEAFGMRASGDGIRGPVQSFARIGQYILHSSDEDALPAGNDVQEHEHRLTVLAKKLNEHRGHAAAGNAPETKSASTTAKAPESADKDKKK
jgi:hypothetical protein